MPPAPGRNGAEQLETAFGMLGISVLTSYIHAPADLHMRCAAPGKGRVSMVVLAIEITSIGAELPCSETLGPI